MTEGAAVMQREGGIWHLEIPAGPAGRYRLAQLDDYERLPRRSFPWRAPLHLRLRARVSSPGVQGTWGFGFWNNPFGMAILRGVEMLRLPALPNAAWFFFASPPNYLSLRDDLPAVGFLAATFRSPLWPGALLSLAAPALPLLALPAFRRLARRWSRRVVRQDTRLLSYDATGWHMYELDLETTGRVRMFVEGRPVLETAVAPLGPLGLVLWVDNQYAALAPDGRLGFGTLENPEPAWLDIADLEVYALV
jgi:hypothetical protein